jgi:hypothetical protein
MQILFLDNVDLRSLNKSHSMIPRIKFFDAESLRNMTFMCSNKDQTDFSEFIEVTIQLSYSTNLTFYSPSTCLYLVYAEYIAYVIPNIIIVSGS